MGTGRAQKRVAKEILHNEPECGITKHRQFSKRIIGGHKAKFAELPWQVRNTTSDKKKILMFVVDKGFTIDMQNEFLSVY